VKRTLLTVSITAAAVVLLCAAFLLGRASGSSSSTKGSPEDTSRGSATTPASSTTTTTTRPAGVDLVGGTDPDPSHWTLSQGEPPQRLQVRLFSNQPALVRDFPVTMNDCDTRQLHVSFRTLSGNGITAGFAFFTDPGQPITITKQVAGVVSSGSMILGGCEQPVFASASGIEDLVVEVAIFEPAVGTLSS